MIWAIIVMICAGADCRIVREMPTFDQNSYGECEDLRQGIKFKPMELREGEYVKTECRPVRDRWTYPDRAV